MFGLIALAAVCGFFMGKTIEQKKQAKQNAQFVIGVATSVKKFLAASNKKEYAYNAGEDWDGR